jgi:hypothetical protein
MSRLVYNHTDSGQKTAEWTPARMVAWTVLLSAMVFWGTLITLP